MLVRFSRYIEIYFQIYRDIFSLQIIWILLVFSVSQILLLLCQIYSWQRFSPILQASSSQGLIVSLALLNLLSFMKSHFSIVLILGKIIQEILSNTYITQSSACVFFWQFGVSGFRFRSLIHLELFLCRVIDTVLISFF